MGFRFAQVSLLAGANDLGGTLGGDELSAASGAPDGVNASIRDLTKIVNDLGRFFIFYFFYFLTYFNLLLTRMKGYLRQIKTC